MTTQAHETSPQEPEYLDIQVTMVPAGSGSAGKVRAIPNPLEIDHEVAGVTWHFEGLPGQPLILFRELRPFKKQGKHPFPLSPEDLGPGVACGVLGPFETFEMGNDRIVASGDNGLKGRFIYEIHVIEAPSPVGSESPTGGPTLKKLWWDNFLGTENFGGLDKTGPPP